MIRRRALAAVVAICALLFSQLAVSAFACPRAIEAAEAAMQMPEGHCGGVPQRNLCDRHCDYGAQTVNQVMPDAAPDVLALPLPWRAEAIVPTRVAAPPAVARLVRSHSPPPLALFGVLRI